MQPLKVHGSIFFLFKKFIISNFTNDMWEKLNDEAQTLNNSFLVTESYPIELMGIMLKSASDNTGISQLKLMERFGSYLVVDLFALYGDYIQPEWKTYEIICNTEDVMHGAVRKLNSSADPPVLNVSKVNDKLLIIDYFSRRRMAPLAIGIIKGIADFYNEADSIIITSTTDPTDERVQIRLDFKN